MRRLWRVALVVFVWTLWGYARVWRSGRTDVSHAVIVGFTTGAAVLIAAGQLKHYLELPIPGGANLS